MTTKVPATMTVEALTAAAQTSALGAKADDDEVVKLTGDQTVAGVKTFSSRPIVPAQSMVRVNTANGYGGTNTKIRRFTNVVTDDGDDITYADSAANGASFTINTAGVYAISYTDSFSGSASYFGLSLNSSQLTTNVASITAANILAYAVTSGADNDSNLSVTVALAANDVVRAHTHGAAAGTNVAFFTITRVD